VNAPPPASLRVAGLVAAVEGAAGLAVAAVLLARGLRGADQRVVNGFGTAIFFAVAGCGVLAAGVALAAGKHWGRGLVVFTQLLLLPVAWYLTAGSHRPVLGAPVAISALSALGLSSSPGSVRWAAGGHQDSASPASSGPETR
jgi:hypothetical protein